MPNVHFNMTSSFFSIQTLTSTAVKKGGLSTGDLAAKYKYKNTLIDVKVDTASIVGYFDFLEYNNRMYTKVNHLICLLSLFQISTTLTFTDVLPSTKTIASFKLPEYNSGKVHNFASAGKFD